MYTGFEVYTRKNVVHSITAWTDLRAPFES